MNDIEAELEHIRVHYQEIETGNKLYNKTLGKVSKKKQKK